MIYFISNNGVQKGPLTFEQLMGEKINGETLIWKEGTSDWVKASEVEELVAVLELMPPPVDSASAVSTQYEKNNASEAETQDDAEMQVGTPDEEGGNTQEKVIDNTRMFSHFLTFKGRSRRSEFWIVYMVDKGLSLLLDFDDLTFWLYLLIIFDLYVILSTGVRRCHDRGHSGFYILIPFYALYLLFADSNPGDNKYGNNPKGVNFRALY